MALLDWEPNLLCVKIRAYEVMSSPVVTLYPTMSVRDLFRLVFKQPHHAYPIVDDKQDAERFMHGHLIGMITTQILSLMLMKKVGALIL